MEIISSDLLANLKLIKGRNAVCVYTYFLDKADELGNFRVEKADWYIIDETLYVKKTQTVTALKYLREVNVIKRVSQGKYIIMNNARIQREIDRLVNELNENGTIEVRDSFANGLNHNANKELFLKLQDELEYKLNIKYKFTRTKSLITITKL